MDFTALFESFNQQNVLVIGDSMIDAYIWGEANRMSPEAPVPVIEVKKNENRLGGAANVALNLKALGANPILCSAIGVGNKATLFLELMKEACLTTTGIMSIKDRKTTVKTRVISDNKHKLRIDEEDTSPIINENELLQLIERLMENIHVIILQDYNKGVLTKQIIKQIISSANKKSIPTIVDPKKQNFTTYKNCTIFKPNLVEINAGMNTHVNTDNIDDIEKKSTELRMLINAKVILLTLSEKGICINSKDTFKHIPACKCEVMDVSGAGDTVVAVAALCLGSSIPYIDLAKLSNLAGSIVCAEVGVIPINKEKLLSEAIKLV